MITAALFGVACRVWKRAWEISVFIEIVGFLVIVFRGLFEKETVFHETALMVHSYERLHGEKVSLNRSVYLYRSRGHADLAIVMDVDRAIASEMEEIIGSGRVAHDILVCINSECDVVQYHDKMPRVLLRVKIRIGKNATCGYGLETPLDVVNLATRAFYGMQLVHPLNQEYGYPFLNLEVLPGAVSGIHAFIGALNRMEHCFIHGPMLYEATKPQTFVSLPVLYTGFFLVFVPSTVFLARDIDVILALTASLGYLHVWLSPISLIYTILRKTSVKSAMLPFLLHCLAAALTNASSIPSNIEAMTALFILPTYISPFLVYRYGSLVLPVALAYIGALIRHLTFRYVGPI